jgi:hypothetical protein
LLHTLPRLPGTKKDCSPITLEVGAQVLVRARDECSSEVSEVVLAHSSSTGSELHLCLDRHYLQRAVKLGFRQLQLGGAGRPLLCQDDTRTYVFMPLDGDKALPPCGDALRLSSGQAESIPSPTSAKTPRRKSLMPRPPNPEPQASNSDARSPAPSPAANGQEPLADPIVEAEILRAVLQEAQARLARLLSALKQQRRQSRALQAAMTSLRSLQLDR